MSGKGTIYRRPMGSVIVGPPFWSGGHITERLTGGSAFRRCAPLQIQVGWLKTYFRPPAQILSSFLDLINNAMLLEHGIW